MNFQDLKTKFKNIVDICVEFVIKNKRYFLAGCIFIAMALVLFIGTSPYTGDNGTAGVYRKFKSNKNTELDKLINDYYTAFASGDIDTLKAIAVPMCDKEVSYTALYSQYIESFNDVKIYTKPGLTKDSYLVTTEVSLKYANIDTLVPGLDFFYVEKNDQGKLYINNTYGTFNRNNNVYELDPQISELYELYIRQDDLRDKRNDVQDRYDEVLKKDPALATLMNETLHEAIVQWNKDYDEQAAAAAEAQAQAEQAAAEAAAAEAEAAAAEEEAQAEQEAAAEEEANSYTGRTNARANVRAEADKESDKLGAVEEGTTVTIYGEEGDFYKFDYNGTTAYITKTAIDLDSETGDDDGAAEEETTTGGSVAEGTVITLTSTTNIRSQMDQSSSKVAVAYSGEKVTVIMSYAEGWTKVKYGKKEGYIRTDLLQQ